MIELRHLCKTYHSAESDVVALDDICLTIEDGEIFGVIGLSGAGKSTLVRCINLLEAPSSGEVIVDGKSLTGLPRKELLELRRSIGMIFQHFNLMPSRTVYSVQSDGLTRSRQPPIYSMPSVQISSLR